MTTRTTAAPAPAAHPWERQPGETEAAFAAFALYRDHGPGRSLLAVYLAAAGGKGKGKAVHRRGAPAGQAPGSWKRWSQVHRWPERAAAFDAHQDRARQRGIDSASEQAGSEWARRRLEAAEDEWQLARKIRQRAHTLASFPVKEETRKHEDGTIVIVNPINVGDLLKIATVARYAQEVSQLATREAMPDDDFDPKTATLEQLAAYVDRKIGHRAS